MIIFLYGQDTFRSRQKLHELKEKFIKEIDKSAESIRTIDGEKSSLAEISQAFGASSLFAKKRMLLIENIFENKNKEVFKDVRDYFLTKEEKSKDKEPDPNENIVIFFEDGAGEKMTKNILWQFLLKQKFVQSFVPLSASGIATWIRKRAEESVVHVTVAQANFIASMYASDLWQIDSELKKLFNYKRALTGTLLATASLNINDDDLRILTRGKVDENIFALSDAIANKNKKLAISLLENEIEAGMAETYLMHMIVRQFRILLQVRQAIDSGLGQRQVASTLKLHPFVVQKSLKQAGSFTLEFLKTIFTKLVELDRDMKSGRAEFKISLDLLIASL